MTTLHEIAPSVAAWLLAGTLAFAGGIAVELPQRPGDCAGCVAVFPYTAGGRGR